jgi:hypothetical protein
LKQSKAGIQACIVINKEDDDRRGAFKIAQKAIGEVMRGKGESKSGRKRKQQAMDQLLPSHTKKLLNLLWLPLRSQENGGSNSRCRRAQDVCLG